MLTRRNFLKTAVISGTGLAALGLVGCGSSDTGSSQSSSSEAASSEASSSNEQATEEAEVITENNVESGGEKNGNVTMGPDSDQKTMVVVQSKSFETLDPFFGSGSVFNRMKSACWDTLWDMEMGGSEEVGLCAKEWTLSDDAMTAYVTIYDNIHDSDGNAITAYDFEWFYNKFLENKTVANLTYLIATGEYTLEMGLKYAYYPGFLYSATSRIVAMAEVAYDAETFISSPVTSGQYVPVSFTSGASATFMQTYDYWGDPDRLCAHRAANVDVIRYEVITENSQIETALLTGSIQVADITASIAEDLEDSEDVDVKMFYEAYPSVFMLNCAEGSIFDGNKDLREAIAYAIDYESMCYVSTSGKGEVTGVMGNASLAGYSEDLSKYAYYSYDPEMAKQKLADAGYSEGDLSMVYVTNMDNEVGTILESCMSDLGINLTIQLKDETAFLTTRQQANLLEWDILYLGTTPKGFFTTMMSGLTNVDTFEFGNYAGVMDTELADAVNTSRYSQSAEDIETAYAMMMDRLYFLPTWNDYGYSACSSKIETLVKDADMELPAQASVFAGDYDVYWDGK